MFYREFCNRFAQAVRKVIAPRLQYSQLLYEGVLFNHVQEKQLWLDLGCGRGILPHWRCAQERELTQRVHILVGMDYDLASLKDNKSIVNKVQGDVSRLPFREACFDEVSANMVFEHLKEPAIQLREIFRVLKPGGEVIFHTPNAWGYGPLLVRCAAKIVSDPIKERIIWFLQRRVPEDVFPSSTGSIRRPIFNAWRVRRDLRCRHSI